MDYEKAYKNLKEDFYDLQAYSDSVAKMGSKLAKEKMKLIRTLENIEKIMCLTYCDGKYRKFLPITNKVVKQIRQILHKKTP